MKGRAERLLPVIDLTAKAEREAAKVLGLQQTALGQVQKQLTDLESYRDDYQNKWTSAGREGVSGQWLIGYQRFLSQLETAIAQQARKVDWQRSVVDKARAAWQEQHAKLEGLRKVVERYRQEARLAEDKREQRQLDELVQRMPRGGRF